MSYSFRRGVCKPHTLPTLHRPFRTNSLPLTTLLLTHGVPATLTFPSPLWLINDYSLFNWRNLIFWEFNTWVLYLHRSPLTFPPQFLPCPLNFLPKSRPLLCLLQWHIYIIFLSKSLGLFSHLLAKLFPGHPQYPFPFLPSICCWGAISLKSFPQVPQLISNPVHPCTASCSAFPQNCLHWQILHAHAYHLFSR